MMLGKIIGKVSTTRFKFKVTSGKTRKLQFIQISHAQYGFVLGQILELMRTTEELIAICNVIGYKDSDGRIKSIRTPFNLGTEVLEAEDEFIKEIIRIDGKGGYLGKLEGKDIKINVDLQKVLTKHLCVLAKSGAGKSYTVGALLEEIMEQNVPLLIIDPHGEYASMKNPSTDKEALISWNLDGKGYGAQIQEYGDMDIKEDVRPIKLNEKMSSYELMKLLPLQLSNTQESILFSVIKDLDEINFDNILLGLEQINGGGKWAIIDTITHLRDLQLFSPAYTPFEEIIAPGKASILNLRGIAPEVQDLIVHKLLKDLFMARKQNKIPPFFCVIEEAHNFAPEKGFGRAKSGEVIRLISSEGRKFGLGLCIVSQRPALVQKTVLSQCTTQIIMKVTNPNDLRAIVSSIEGITPETENEIQNLPVGSALICGVVDRPLLVNIRPRRSQHGGTAVNMLGDFTQEKKVEKLEEFTQNVVEESLKFEEQGLLYLIKPKLSIKDIELMSDQPIKEIKTYLIPATFFTCMKEGMVFNILVDRVKGMVIKDPETDEKYNISAVGVENQFLRKPEFTSLSHDVKIEPRLDSNHLKGSLLKYCKVKDYKECFIVFRKIDY